jgi:glycosyltransferase involved in cell wall biosynthesis
MNILIEAGDINPFFSEGTKNIVLTYSRELKKRGNNIVILTRRRSKVTGIKHPRKYEEIEGVKVYRWDNYLDLFFIYKKIIKKEKIEVIHLFSKGLRPLSYIKFLRYFIRKPIIFTSTGFPYSRKYSREKFIETVKNVNLMTIPSNYIFKQTKDFLGKNYLYVPYGIDINKFKAGKNQKSKEIKIACLRSSEREILIAFNRINNELKNAVFIFNKKELEKNESLREFVSKERVKAELIPELKDISLLLKDIDLLVDLHNPENYLVCASPPLLILEAMACEKKVISTKNGEIEEVLENDKNGFLIEKNDSKNIYNAIKRALSIKTDIGKNARKTIATKYDIKKLAPIYEEIYKKVINS